MRFRLTGKNLRHDFYYGALEVGIQRLLIYIAVKYNNLETLEIADTSKDNLPQEEQEASEKEDPHMYERALLYIIKECQKLHVDLSYNILDSLKNNGDIIMQS